MKTDVRLWKRPLIRHILLALAVAGLLVVLKPAPGTAADREHQQIMADMRMLQEQTQQLHATLGGLTNTLTDALKNLTAKLDDQTALTRKAFADDKLTITNVAGDLRVVREKVDETNVRLSSLSQELEALRQAIPPPAPPVVLPAVPSSDGEPSPGAAAPPPPVVPAPPPAPVGPGMSPQRLYETAWADYSSGQWTLAIQGFETFLRYYPKSDLANQAQYYIGETHYADGKFNEATTAYTRVITNYPGGAYVPQAYYKRGLALERLGQAEEARQSFETVTKQYPDSDAGRLARQALDRLNRPAR